MNQSLAVAAIKYGSVLDHIPRGQGLRILQFLNLSESKEQITIGLNLPSGSLQQKDLIKMEGRLLNVKETHTIGIFAPNATLNIIDNYTVQEKIKLALPTQLHGTFSCLNPNCITQQETITSHFHILQQQTLLRLCCHYCSKHFKLEELITGSKAA